MSRHVFQLDPPNTILAAQERHRFHLIPSRSACYQRLGCHRGCHHSCVGAGCSSGTWDRARGKGVQQHHLVAPGLAGSPGRLADRSALPIAGDDPAAKAAVAGFLDAIGYDTVGDGPLGSGGRRF